MEHDSRLLKIDSVPIVHLRWMNSELDDKFRDAFETMLHMKQEGLLRHIGLSNVTEEQLDYALERTEIVTISNAYIVYAPDDDTMVERSAKEGIAYLPFFPLAVGKAATHRALQHWAEELQVTPTQVALAWLLHRSPALLPIPSTSSLEHLIENYGALDITLPADALASCLPSGKNNSLERNYICRAYATI